MAKRGVKVSIVTLASLVLISLTGACSAPTTSSPDMTSGDRANGGGMVRQVTFSCAPAAGADVAEPDRICAELLDAFNEARPDLRFVAGRSGAPAVRVVITHSTPRGLGLEATWVDVGGSSTPARPLSTAFFDRSSAPELRRNFYAAFLMENPIPF